MREKKFRYTFEHVATGNVEKKIYTLSQLEERNAKELSPCFHVEFGYKLIGRDDFTGLKDKNGKEIYEGDVVEYNDFNSLRTGGHAEDKIIVGKVAFSCGMWMVEAKNCGHDLYEGLVNDEELEIIGNIYNNPELLEGTA